MLTSEAKFLPRTASLQTQPLSANCHFIQQKYSWMKADRFSSLVWVVIASAGLLMTLFNSYIVQKTVAQVCTLCWQVGLVFGFIGLIISLLFAQTYLTCRCDRTQSKLNRWNILSSVTVMAFTVSLVVCILVSPPVG